MRLDGITSSAHIADCNLRSMLTHASLEPLKMIMRYLLLDGLIRTVVVASKR
jgi:hypothetical protein